MTSRIPVDLSIPKVLSRDTTSANDDETVPEISVEAYDKIRHWRNKLDRTAKLDKRAVFECAAADLFLEAEYERDRGAVRAISDEIYMLGRDHTGLSDDDIQDIMVGAKGKAEWLDGDPLDDFPLLRDAGEPTAARGKDEPPPVTSPDEYGTSNRNKSQSAEPEINLAETFTFLGDAPHVPPRELINGLIPAEGVAVTGGQSTAGKTFVGIYKSICLATATPYFGRKIVERVGTVFVAAEGRPLLPNRFAASLIKLSIEAKLPITWPNLLPDFSCAAGIKLFVRQLKAIDERYRGDFGVRLGHVPIDTVAATFGMKDEDDNAEATRVCNVLRSVGDETGALMAPVHHYGKNPESGLRGASAWKGSADVIEGVLADIDPLTGRTSNRELVCAKARDGEQGPISPFDLEFIELGLKDDGEIYGSCCVVPCERASRFGKAPAPSKSQRTIMAAIDEVLGSSSGKYITPRDDMPKVRAVKVVDVRTEFDRLYVVPDSDPAKASAAKRMAFKRALDWLSPAKFGAIATEGADWIWKIT